MSLEKINMQDAVNAFGGVGNNDQQSPKCELGINHFYDSYVISPSGFANAEHCNKFEMRELEPMEVMLRGKSKTGCKYCVHYKRYGA